ncbi:MAG: hypothetical protein II841_04940 [Bacteroidales bacterium]|nr:hypothetical protein [Bacteroidales bacterium]
MLRQPALSFSETMPKTEFYKPTGLPGERPVPSISVDADELLALLLRAELMMNATDRRRYADRAIGQIQDVIREFTLAWDFEDDRYEHLKRMWGAIAVFLRTMRIIGKVNAIRVQPKYETMSPDEMKIKIMERMASLEDGAESWRRSVVKIERERRRKERERIEGKGKGTTGSDGWNRQSPEE